MKAKSSIAILFLVAISALALYAFAQAQSDKQRGEMQNSVRKTLLIDKQVITLFQAQVQRDGFVGARISSSGKPETFRNATLRIKMMDKSIKEMPLADVKEITIEQSGNIR